MEQTSGLLTEAAALQYLAITADAQALEFPVSLHMSCADESPRASDTRLKADSAVPRLCHNIRCQHIGNRPRAANSAGCTAHTLKTPGRSPLDVSSASTCAASFPSVSSPAPLGAPAPSSAHFPAGGSHGRPPDTHALGHVAACEAPEPSKGIPPPTAVSNGNLALGKRCWGSFAACVQGKRAMVQAPQEPTGALLRVRGRRVLQHCCCPATAADRIHHSMLASGASRAAPNTA